MNTRIPGRIIGGKQRVVRSGSSQSPKFKHEDLSLSEVKKLLVEGDLAISRTGDSIYKPQIEDFLKSNSPVRKLQGLTTSQVTGFQVWLTKKPFKGEAKIRVRKQEGQGKTAKYNAFLIRITPETKAIEGLLPTGTRKEGS